MKPHRWVLDRYDYRAFDMEHGFTTLPSRGVAAVCEVCGLEAIQRTFDGVKVVRAWSTDITPFRPLKDHEEDCENMAVLLVMRL